MVNEREIGIAAFCLRPHQQNPAAQIKTTIIMCHADKAYNSTSVKDKDWS